MPIDRRDGKWYPRIARDGEIHELQRLAQLEKIRRRRYPVVLSVGPQRATLEHMEKDDVIRTRAPRLLKLAHEKCAALDDREPADYLRKLIKDDVVRILGADWEEKIRKELKAGKKK